ncbi:hypothetical protein ACFL3G_07425 [Planctomycetota bacterium]
MRKPGSNILKSQNVKLEGNFVIELLGSPAAAANTPVANTNIKPQVGIVENQQEFAVIEVTCSCGTKTRIKCNYAEIQAQQVSQTETVGENDNEN